VIRELAENANTYAPLGPDVARIHILVDLFGEK